MATTDVTADFNGVALWVDGVKVRIFDSMADARRAQRQVNNGHREWAHDALGMLAACLAKMEQGQ